MLFRIFFCFVCLIPVIVSRATGSSSEIIHSSVSSFAHHQQQQSGNDHASGSSSNQVMIRRFISDANQISSHQSNLTVPCFERSKDTSYTKSWKLEDWYEHCSGPLSRYSRHIKMLWGNSSTATAVLPTVGIMVLWSIIVSTSCRFLPEHSPIITFVKDSKLSSSIIGLFTSPIALLLTLKTNRALDRVLDARKAWGAVLRSSRSLMSLLFSYASSSSLNSNDTSNDLGLVLLAGRYLVLLGWCLKAWLIKLDDESVIRLVLPPDEAQWLISSASTSSADPKPLAIVGRLRSICSKLATQQYQDGKKTINHIAHLQMEERIYDIETSIGTMSRISTSPIPPTYTRHTSRVLCLYLTMLPIALAGITGMAVKSSSFLSSSLALCVTVALTSYVLVGIDELSLEMEHPFPILPMTALSSMIQNSIVNQVLLGCTIPQFSRNNIPV